MTPSFLKRLAASGTAAIVLAGMLLLGSGLTARAIGGGCASQRTRRDMAGAALGPRLSDGRGVEDFPVAVFFRQRGTLTATTAGQFPALSTPPLGVWHHVKGHNYSAVSEAFVFSPAGAWIQTHRLTRAIRVHGDEFTDTVALEIFDTSGNLIVTGCGTSLATRFEMSEGEDCSEQEPTRVYEGARWLTFFFGF